MREPKASIKPTKSQTRAPANTDKKRVSPRMVPYSYSLWVYHLKQSSSKYVIHTDLSHAAFTVAVSSHLPIRNSIDPRNKKILLSVNEYNF